ncbi:hypothetical protein HYY72_04045 [Candidatus Woesearchaeota archaeon]|nr:hypothetical protein [Candidatus Woesearchaeota archaeon]
MSFLQNTGNALLDPLVILWDKFVTIIPGIIGGLLVIAIGYIVGMAFGYLLHKFLEHLKLDDQIRKAGVAHSIGFISVSNLIGALLKWYIVALFIVPAAELMRLGVLSTFLKDFARWIPGLIIAIIIVLAGLIITDYLADRMLHARRKGVRAFSAATRWFLIIFVMLTALNQIGIDVSLASSTTLILVAGLSIGLAIAVGLGFGLAMKEEAKGIIKQLKKGL